MKLLFEHTRDTRTITYEYVKNFESLENLSYVIFTIPGGIDCSQQTGIDSFYNIIKFQFSVALYSEQRIAP